MRFIILRAVGLLIFGNLFAKSQPGARGGTPGRQSRKRDRKAQATGRAAAVKDMISVAHINAAKHFVELALRGEPPDDETLLRGLDQVVAAYHDAPEGRVRIRLKYRFTSRQERWDLLNKRFPDYDLYAVTDPIEPLEQPMGADPIRDLAIITLDLEEVLWRFEKFGLDDASRRFRKLYEVRLSRHARSLGFYLHTRLWPEPRWAFWKLGANYIT